MILDEAVAVQELIAFVEYHEDEKKTEEEIKKTKKGFLKGLVDGNVIIDEEQTPMLQLKTPIKNKDGDVVVTDITFKTRIKPSDARNIARGMDLAKDSLGYVQKCMVYLMIVKDVQGQNMPINETFLDKFSKYDYKIIEEITSSFL